MILNMTTVKERWLEWQAEHPMLAGLVVVAESAAVSAGVDVCANGVDFSTRGLKHAGTIVGTAVFLAVRNYLKDNAKTLRAQIAAKQFPVD